MSTSRIPQKLRRAVRDRAGGRCEYCRYPDGPPSCAAFQCDHCVPASGGGATSADNLAWSCPACNAAKAGAAEVPDPRTGRPAPLFHPRRDAWADHFRWSADLRRVIGRTAVGRATVVRLRMNRPDARESRGLLRLLGLHPPPDGSAE